MVSIIMHGIGHLAYLKLSLLGGHLGRDKTYNKVADRYHWKCMYKDIEAYIRTCEVCQKTNYVKFMKATASLHPIPVPQEVWKQVQQN